MLAAPVWALLDSPVLEGDCLEVLRWLPDGAIDAIVTDPPYGIGFMGHEWDQPSAEHGPVSSGHRGCNVSFGGPPHPAMEAGRYDLSSTANRRFQAWCEAWARECLRVLKPGGHMVVFGSPRTYHRLATGVEDAGFEIRDTLAWMFGSGFPKSLNLDGEWMGWGTALKPGYEPIVLARKPLSGTVAATVLEHGTGALNIDACRIDGAERPVMVRTATVVAANAMSGKSTGATASGETTNLGRWPANVLLDEAAGALLDAASGSRPSGSYGAAGQGTYGAFGERETAAIDASTGGASRFFYSAKASTGERNAGLDGLPAAAARVTLTPTSTLAHARSGGQRVDERVPAPAPRANVHPTVKPIELMRWLLRLVTPPGGIVLDPFAGSGTTLCAAALEGIDCIGIEREQQYVEIARARHAFWAAQPAGISVEDALAGERLRRDIDETGQLGLLAGEAA